MADRSALSCLFVGEKPSGRAYAAGLTWRDGMLAARTLSDALHACGVEPEAQDFVNLFGDTPDASERPGPETSVRANTIRAMARGRPVVAMGNKVSTVLGHHGVTHIRMIHPAARGRIRKKELYIQHVAGILDAVEGATP